VAAGTPVRIRLRAFHQDVSGVRVRLYSINAAAEQLLAMTKAADDVSCYDTNLPDDTCDFWELTLPDAEPDNLWYRFIVTDGTATAYYADDTPALDGGLGSATTGPVDDSYALTVYAPDFRAPEWPASAVMYQIFPDRFRNGDTANDPQTGDVRYDQPVLKLDWETLPEGYCRAYDDSAANCPWRFESSPPDWSPTIEGPQGRDYMGGDLRGVTDELDYLQQLGVGAIYLNPIFDSASNHGYDTQDYTKVDPYFGTQADFDALIAAAQQRGIRVILDGVFNHMSSDSPFFDRYGHYDTTGACESADSPWRLWFTFTLGPGSGPCAAPGGPNKMVYDAWAGFDTIPTISKTRPDVLDYFIGGVQSIVRQWLGAGIGGWRMDVSGDPSFPNGYWESFRQVVKAANPDALTISETWQKDSTLLRELRGDRFDTTMNYRLRDAVLGLLTPDVFDPKGFADSGHTLTPSQFAARLLSMQEDYAPPAYHSLMNLLDSHDTERALWDLTPGAWARDARELDATNLAEGKRRLEMAALIQFTIPGMPSIYYGDEVGMTGDTDPDNRRTYPWADLGGAPDQDLMAYYKRLSGLRFTLPVLAQGDLRVLLTDDTSGVVALGRRSDDQAAIVAVNRGPAEATVSIATAGFVPEGTVFDTAFAGTSGGANTSVTASGGAIQLTLAPESGLVLATNTGVDLLSPGAPGGHLVASESDGQVGLTWTPTPDAAGYNVYRSPLAGGGWVKVNDSPVSTTSFTDIGLTNARTVYYSVTALDEAGNESGYSGEVGAVPHLALGSAKLIAPETATQTISTNGPPIAISGTVTTSAAAAAGPPPSVWAQVGCGPHGSAPDGNADWRWGGATFTQDVAGGDEYGGKLLPDRIGSFDCVVRFSTTAGRDWAYADLGGIFTGTPSRPGTLTVNASSDTTPPATPTGLTVESASVLGVDLQWQPIASDPTLYGYEVARSDTATGPFRTIAVITDATFHDPDVNGSAPIYYVVRAVDSSFNRSPDSAPVEARPGPRPVHLVFNVTIPAPTGPAVGRTVFIAGTLDQLNGDLPQWDPAGVAMTQVDDTHWTVSLDGQEGTNLEYKYVLGDWAYVEKDASCGEISNRRLILTYGQDGTQTVEDSVLNWRGVGSCPA
jgi:glycosidase/fibronectin type 3 domain-containing protein